MVGIVSVGCARGVIQSLLDIDEYIFGHASPSSENVSRVKESLPGEQVQLCESYNARFTSGRSARPGAQAPGLPLVLASWGESPLTHVLLQPWESFPKALDVIIQIWQESPRSAQINHPDLASTDIIGMFSLLKGHDELQALVGLLGYWVNKEEVINDHPSLWGVVKKTCILEEHCGLAIDSTRPQGTVLPFFCAIVGLYFIVINVFWILC
ncbi:hypothetical protein RHGRI_017061 [Rhododendron griersonianum]|uniref:Uncharacterized protein n=1 Tax=Rhododendron griersonianum TaxID=479676 RepID=A0AAV6JWI4_9ERIC|nr:hypothetical protein RHGRI_017061 [Rhododendron griersonianum]